ncbi:hypothetical protein B0J13DRAFT_528396 [Dactylonectria estremocensis]|uniref:Uncharacterized protein n=1 Tax=Dactylonectria estremocensis TaxID=1079267 RepID=A0A9P9IVC1_9HYPO|nr:hypothetical protein B0J13DRAFT_528396 [Dactylonectria estremocensis]
MAGIMTCSTSKFTPEIRGKLYTRESVVVANISEVNIEDDPPLVKGDTRGWSRAFPPGTQWFDSSNEPSGAVVEFSFFRTDELHVKWARTEPWRLSLNNTVPTARRVKHKLHSAVAEVRRHVENGRCALLVGDGSPIQILSNDQDPPVSEGANMYTAHIDKWTWAEAMVTTWGHTPREGISSVLQVALTIFLDTLETMEIESPLHFVSTGDCPLGTEISPGSSFRVDHLDYPFIDGAGWMAIGCMVTAIHIFLAIGCFSVTVALVRVWIGPPIFTSWMGQHIFLAQSGVRIALFTFSCYGISSRIRSPRGTTILKEADDDVLPSGYDHSGPYSSLGKGKVLIGNDAHLNRCCIELLNGDMEDFLSHGLGLSLFNRSSALSLCPQSTA